MQKELVVPEVDWDTWGSCQYQSAASVFYYMKSLFAEVKTVTNFSARTGVLITAAPRTMKEAVTLFQKLNREYVEEILAEEKRDFGEGSETFINAQKHFAQFEQLKNFDDVLNWCAASAWDLFAPIERYMHCCFERFSIVGLGEQAIMFLEDVLGDIGQKTGFYCWLLFYYNFVTDEEAFKGWDT